MGGYLGQHVGHTDAVACLALDANFLFSGLHCCYVYYKFFCGPTNNGNIGIRVPKTGKPEFRTLRVAAIV
eukprot:1092664-Pelagomonas_calceolata.AAC.3